MKQCTASALLPPPEHVVRLAAPGSPPEAGHVLCELGEGHEGDHAAMLWDDDANDEAVWARWNANGTNLAGLLWCVAPDARGESSCGLFARHPSGHGWEIVDAAADEAAVEAALAGEYPHLFPA
ncbi:hypothetical protein [Streptomyces sp. cmx-18-6]|uniref:hypothetical protein n=1 Tax=Streptomyces sp. cmx-18-6 TaxID=2790930 RepID=UPI0039813FC3